MAGQNEKAHPGEGGLFHGPGFSMKKAKLYRIPRKNALNFSYPGLLGEDNGKPYSIPHKNVPNFSQPGLLGEDNVKLATHRGNLKLMVVCREEFELFEVLILAVAAALLPDVGVWTAGIHWRRTGGLPRVRLPRVILDHYTHYTNTI